MKDAKEISEEIVKVPVDMLMDIFTIIVKEVLRHEVIDVQPNRSLMTVAVFYDKNAPRQQKVIDNIKNLVYDYQHYRSWENEEFNWRA